MTFKVRALILEVPGKTTTNTNIPLKSTKILYAKLVWGSLICDSIIRLFLYEYHSIFFALFSIFSYNFFYCYHCSNHCYSNSCHSFSILEAKAKSCSLPSSIAFRSEKELWLLLSQSWKSDILLESIREKSNIVIAIMENIFI